MVLTASSFLTLSFGPSAWSKRSTYDTLLIMLVCMLIPHIVLGGIVVYRIIQRASTKFKLSSKKLKIVMERVFHRNKRETMDIMPIKIESDITLSQRLSFPTEKTSLIIK